MPSPTACARRGTRPRRTVQRVSQLVKQDADVVQGYVASSLAAQAARDNDDGALDLGRRLASPAGLGRRASRTQGSATIRSAVNGNRAPGRDARVSRRRVPAHGEVGGALHPERPCVKIAIDLTEHGRLVARTWRFLPFLLCGVPPDAGSSARVWSTREPRCPGRWQGAPTRVRTSTTSRRTTVGDQTSPGAVATLIGTRDGADSSAGLRALSARPTAPARRGARHQRTDASARRRGGR